VVNRGIRAIRPCAAVYLEVLTEGTIRIGDSVILHQQAIVRPEFLVWAGRRLGFGLVRLDSRTLAGLIAGTILTLLLLCAQSSGDPWHTGVWILLSASLSMLTGGYGMFVTSHEDEGSVRYVAGFIRTVARGWPIVVASLPTVLLLLLAAAFRWPDDHEDSGGVTIGYTTILGNLNVFLLFLWGAMSARRGGLSVPWTVLVGLGNAILGWLVVTANLALKA
jgi:hypothetical protein